MDFNIAKRAVLNITRKRNISNFQYSIFGKPLSTVDQHEYLGVTISNDLRWNHHCEKSIKKANRTLGLLRRTLTPCTKDVKIKAYESLVRPRLEYASEAWNPHTTSTVDRLEQVQRAAARFIHRDYRRETHVTPLLTALGWDSLHYRRLLAQSVMFFKIQHSLVNIRFPPCVSPATFFARRDHQLKFNTIQCTIDPYKFSFYPRTIRIWNSLPATAVTASSILVFRKAAMPAIRAMLPPVGSRLL